MELQEWVTLNRLDAKITSNFIEIDNHKYLILYRERDEILFDEDFDFLLSSHEQSAILNAEITQLVFRFGDKWYYSTIENVKLNPLKHLGKEKTELDFPFPYLGVHGEYDLCNGSRLYPDWCKKAKFLNSPSLAICENNTLAGTLSFQISCKEAGIKSILGETVTVSIDDKKSYTYQIKLYAKNYDGWVNLLNINSQIKVFNDGYVLEDYIFSHSYGLVCVLGSECDANMKNIENYRKEFDDDLYFQLDLVEWLSSDKDKEYLLNLKNTINSQFANCKPVIICDAYYLDKDDGHIKKVLNTIGKVPFQNQSNDQYFKSLQEIFDQFSELAPNEDWLNVPFFTALENTVELADKCNFEIKLGELHLPKYEMTESEAKEFETNEDLFYHLVFKGFEDKKNSFCKPEEEYLERIETEVDVIKRGGFIDYFLITWDILNWCKTQNILTGAGRGSVAGSVIAYFLNISTIDPFKYNLLFSRFLNESRIKTGLPDIDSDIMSDGRDLVKRYMEQRYGINYVTSIGTYGTFKIRQGLKDLCRQYNYPIKQANIITSIIDADFSQTDTFKLAANKSENLTIIKNFIQYNPKIIEDFSLISGQVKTSSVHAAGVVIVPKEYNGKKMTIYDWMPIKKIDGVLVTEWEGPQIEKMGFLKEDILGVEQLQKLHEIFALIKQNRGIDINYDSIPVEDDNVYKLFQDGSNEDVFQFTSIGLKAYCRELKPIKMDDLIVAMSLYRPGPMDTGGHKTYIKIKNGEREPEYDYMLEEVTKNTYGQYCFQEQVMQAMMVLGGFSESDSDSIRAAMGKKIIEKMEQYKIQFLEGAMSKGCEKYEAIKIWNKLETFARYGFNASHAAAYSHISYYCQWLKYHYPLEFWSVALNRSSQDEISKRIAEMHKVSDVKVLPPDINQYTNKFEADKERNVIYWSIGSIKQIGEKTLEAITSERDSNGKYFSFDDFLSRVNKSVVNKRCIINLILSGCFDIVEKITVVTDRLKLLKRYICEILNETLPVDFNSSTIWKESFWILKQKELTGFGYLDFDKIFKNEIQHQLRRTPTKLDPSTFQDESLDKKGNICVVGLLSECQDKKMRNKPETFGSFTINCNDENIAGIMWDSVWTINGNKEKLMNAVNKVVCITGYIQFDSKYSMLNQLKTDENTEVIVLE